MRPYPVNSPEAAARIIALSVFADRDIGGLEIARLEQLALHQRLGLSLPALNEVFDHFLEDLVATEQLQWSDDCPVDELTLFRLLDDLDNPALRQRVMNLCVSLIEADGVLDVGESRVLSGMAERWGLPYRERGRGLRVGAAAT